MVAGAERRQDLLSGALAEPLRRLGLKDAQVEKVLRWLLFGLLGLLLLRLPKLIGGFEGTGAGPVAVPQETSQVGEGPWREEERALERELESVLMLVRGAGRVKVTLTFAASSEKRFGHNLSENVQRTEERDASGTVRSVLVTTRTEQVVLARQGGQDQAVVSVTTRPQVIGALVVAEGGGDSRVRADLTRAVQALLGLPPHKVRVLPMGR